MDEDGDGEEWTAGAGAGALRLVLTLLNRVSWPNIASVSVGGRT